MLRRLFVGLVKGILIGGIVAALVIQLLGSAMFGAVLAYSTAVLVGVLSGLFAGKPFWAKDARIEVILKSVVGAVVAAAAMFALRKWVPAELDLSALGAGAGSIGWLPAVSLPLIAAFLAVVFELDNTTDVPATDERAAIAAPKQRAPAADTDLGELEDEEPSEVAHDQSRRKR